MKMLPYRLDSEQITDVVVARNVNNSSFIREILLNNSCYCVILSVSDIALPNDIKLLS